MIHGSEIALECRSSPLRLVGLRRADVIGAAGINHRSDLKVTITNKEHRKKGLLTGAEMGGRRENQLADTFDRLTDQKMTQSARRAFMIIMPDPKYL